MHNTRLKYLVGRKSFVKQWKILNSSALLLHDRELCGYQLRFWSSNKMTAFFATDESPSAPSHNLRIQDPGLIVVGALATFSFGRPIAFLQTIKEG